MNLFPAESSSKLGLDVIFDWLVHHVAGEATLGSHSEIRSFSTVEEVRSELKLVDELQQCLRFGDPLGFREFSDIRATLARASMRGTALDALDLRAVAKVVELGLATRQYFADRKDTYPTVFGSLAQTGVQSTVHQLILQSIDEQGEIHDSASSELRRIRRELVGARNRVREAALKALAHASSQGFAADDQPTVRGGRLVIPIRAEAKRKISGFVHDVSASGQTVFIEPESALLGNNVVRELELEESRELNAIRIHFTDLIRDVLPDFKSIFFHLTRIDLQLSKARLANQLSGVVPEVGQEGVIRITEGRNPALLLHFLEQGSSRKVVPFSLTLGNDELVMMISGPNAGGKSVTMKAVGLLAVMVAHGIPVPVGEMSRFDLFDAVFVDMGDEQSISDDLSTFTSHLKNLSYILTHATESSLALIDEAGTGTDPEAGGVLARATIEELLVKRVRAIVTTHYGPLKIFAHETEGIRNGSMAFDQEELRPTYEFVPGVPGSSYAAEIAQRVGLMPSVIERARALMGHKTSSAESLIADLMSKNAELDRSLQSNQQLQSELTTQRAALAERLKQLQEQKDDIRSEALRKADDIIQNANRTIENTVRQIRETAASKSAIAAARKEVEETKSQLQTEINRTAKKKRSRGRKKETGEAVKSPILVGDRVKLVDTQSVGEVVQFEGKNALVAFGSIQMKVKRDQLQRVGGKAKQEVRVKQQSSTSGVLSAHSVQIRLDIRGKRVDEALSEIIPFLDRGLGSGIERVEVLHGKGTGALRQVLHDYLATANGIARFEEAPIMEGGAGVTYIYF